MRISDWSSDVCSSDLLRAIAHRKPVAGGAGDRGFGLGVERIHLKLCGSRHLRADPVDRIERPTPFWRGPLGGNIHIAATNDPDHGFIEHAGRSEEHTSELQSLMRISYAVFFLN